MAETSQDHGLSTTQLWTIAWLLGLAAVGCAGRLLVYAAGSSQVQAESFVWAVLGVLAGVFSAACAVLVGVKSAEARLAALQLGPADVG